MTDEHVTEVIEEDATEDNTDEEPRIDEDEPEAKVDRGGSE